MQGLLAIRFKLTMPIDQNCIDNLYQLTERGVNRFSAFLSDLIVIVLEKK